MQESKRNNTNACKWTLELAEEFCQKVLDEIKSDNSICSLAEATSNLGKYESLLDYLKNKYEVDGFVFGSLKEAKEIIKSRILKKGLEGTYNATMSIFILKNNHDMKDKQENVNTNTTTVTTINLGEGVNPDETTT